MFLSSALPTIVPLHASLFSPYGANLIERVCSIEVASARKAPGPREISTFTICLHFLWDAVLKSKSLNTRKAGQGPWASPGAGKGSKRDSISFTLHTTIGAPSAAQEHLERSEAQQLEVQLTIWHTGVA